MSTRLHNWSSRLAVYFETLRRAPFGYGKTDCACFAAGAVEAMTGVDPMADLRGRYDTAASGKRLLKSLGAESVGDFVARSFEEVHPARARRGDLALLATEGPFGAALGVVVGERVMAMSEAGLDSRPRREMKRAFRV